jgi:TnpA family transposase
VRFWTESLPGSIRDLPSKRLYAFAPAAADDAIRPLIAGKIRQELIERNWPDILRLSASAAVGAVAPSRILKRLASYPRQNDLALALSSTFRISRGVAESVRESSEEAGGDFYGFRVMPGHP